MGAVGRERSGQEGLAFDENHGSSLLGGLPTRCRAVSASCSNIQAKLSGQGPVGESASGRAGWEGLRAGVPARSAARMRRARCRRGYFPGRLRGAVFSRCVDFLLASNTITVYKHSCDPGGRHHDETDTASAADSDSQHARGARGSPTRAEIAQAFGFASHNTAEEHLRALAKG